uniref:BTB domain-containing protein n=1 Tax=Heligmosomoides polygyrus TaxID=6339 RepID=A0A8L8KA68_HELPZ
LFLKTDYSDVTFVVEGERFHAHKMILSIRCEYFKAMLYGGLKESSEAEIELKGADAVAFRAVLQYIYSVQVDLSNFNIEELFSILRLAHEYRLKILNVDIVFTIAETSALLSVDSLVEACKRFCDQHAVEVLKSKVSRFQCIAS